MPILGLALIAAFVAAVAWLAHRAGEVFVVRVRNGVVTTRGTVPAALRSDLADVLRRSGIRNASLRGVRRGGRIVLDVHGVGVDVAQRLRNTFAMHRL